MAGLCRRSLCRSFSRASTLDLLLLKCHFRFRLVHLIGGHDSARGFGWVDPCLLIDSPFGDLPYLLLEDSGVFSPALTNDFLILLDSVDRGIVGLLGHRYIRIVVPLIVRRVIVDHRVIDHRRCTVVVDDGRVAYVGHPDIPVTVHTGETVLVDHNGVVYVGMPPDIDVDTADVDVRYDHLMTASPVAVAVICLSRCQRHPSHVFSTMNP